ncbi:MAG: hypothetical protein AB1Z98_25170, partial [Nannocystaceae bacterium]
MAHVIAQTGLGSMLDNRPALASGALGALLTAALTVLLMHAPTPSIDDDAIDELPFTPGLILALGSPEAEARVEDPSVAPPTEPTEPTEAAVDDADSSPEDAVTDDPVPPAVVRPPKPAPPRPPKPAPPSVS